MGFLVGMGYSFRYSFPNFDCKSSQNELIVKVPNFDFVTQFIFLVGPQFGPWIGPKSSWPKRGLWSLRGLAGQV